MASDLQNKVIRYINSRNRTSGTPTNFSIDIDVPAQADRVAVMAFAIPKIYYGEYGTFQLTENSQTVTIQTLPGNYDIDQFRVMIASQLNTYSPYKLIYTVKFNQILGKFTYMVSMNPNIYFVGFTTNDTLYGSLGFDPNSSYAFNNNFLTSTNVVNVNLDSNLFIQSSICTNSGDQILQEIYTTQNKANQFITWYSPDVVSYCKVLSGSQAAYSFWLTDDQNNVIDLNGGCISLTLIFFKSSTLPDKQANYIDLMTYQALKVNNATVSTSTSTSSSAPTTQSSTATSQPAQPKVLTK